MVEKRGYRCGACKYFTRRPLGTTRPCTNCGAPPARLVLSNKRGGTHRRGENRAGTPVVRHLIDLVTERGWTAADVADYVKLAHNSLSVWRTGKMDPSLRSLEALADALGYELKLVRKGQSDARD